MQRLLKIIMDEPILYKAYYTMAIATGLRRGELCALRWKDITGPLSSQSATPAVVWPSREL